jgi:hypothetical protein
VNTMRHEVIGDTMLVVHGACAAASEEWNALCRDFDTLDFTGVLIVANRGCPGPTSHQRVRLAESFTKRGRYPNSAVVTDSPAHRGIVTVLNWMQKATLKAYGPARFTEALKYVGVAPSQREPMLRRIQELAVDLNAPCIVPTTALDSTPEAHP